MSNFVNIQMESGQLTFINEKLKEENSGIVVTVL